MVCLADDRRDVGQAKREVIRFSIDFRARQNGRKALQDRQPAGGLAALICNPLESQEFFMGGARARLAVLIGDLDACPSAGRGIP